MEPTPLPTPPAALATGRGVRRVPGLAAFLGCPVSARRGEVVLAWGLRPSAARAERVARSRGLPLWRLEDGFLRSLGLTDPPLSLVVDDRGIHYGRHPALPAGGRSSPAPSTRRRPPAPRP